MPLHSIPLCNFKYAGDVYSKTIFDYDGSSLISKANYKFVSNEDPSTQEVNSTKLLSRNKPTFEKCNNTKLLYRILNGFTNYDKSKLLKSFIEGLTKDILKPLQSLDKGIDIDNPVILAEANNRELGLQDIKELSIPFIADIFTITNKELLRIINDIWIKNSKELSEPNDLEITQQSSEGGLESVNDLLFVLNTSLELVSTHITNINWGDVHKYYELPLDVKTMAIYNNQNYMDRYSIKGMAYKNNSQYVFRINDGGMDKTDAKYVNTQNIRDLFLNFNSFIELYNPHELFELHQKLLDRFNDKLVDKYNKRLLDRKIDNKELLKDSTKRLLNRYGIFEGFNIRSSHLLDRFAQSDMFKYHDIFIEHFAYKNIYRQLEKGLIKDMGTNLFKLYNVYLNYATNIPLFKNTIYGLSKSSLNIDYITIDKSLEVTKRWWWLNPTQPTDTLIIPNMDFNYDSSLLNNPDFEYLRFINHPISWGDNFGIDFNVPAYSLSVEIMLDLVNIIIMIWHSKVQIWMNCTGKESMQFLMELLYDWYALPTSKPNTDYYRAYRWIRWEAEKVYFLNLDNGLQAIGRLIANLIDYLKYHEFNQVPLWRNLKAMDVERNFNRLAQNGDLIKQLDKTKGKRYYYIETKNVDNKNISGDDV